MSKIDWSLSLPKRRKENLHNVASDYQLLNINVREYNIDS